MSDWRRVAAVYAGLFGLDPARFSEIGSERFGYIGTLTLFDPPNRLDRIELSQVTDNVHAMGRFANKHGDSLYMCYVEVHDWPAVRGRLLEANARYTPRGSGSGDRSRRRLGASQGTARPAARHLAHRSRLGLVGPRRSRAAGMNSSNVCLVLRSCSRPRWPRRRQPAEWQTVVGARPAVPARDAGAGQQDHGRREGEGPRQRARRLGLQARRARCSTSTMSTTSPAGSPAATARRWRATSAAARPRRPSRAQVQVRARRADHPAGLGRLCARHRGRRRRRRDDAHLHRQGPAVTACWSRAKHDRRARPPPTASSIRCELAETRQ